MMNDQKADADRIGADRHDPHETPSDRSIAKSTKVIARLTAVMAFTAVASAVVSGGQWWEIHSASSDTKKLIEANQILAEAAKKQAEVAADSAQTAHDALISDQRAWVGPVNAKLDGTLKTGEAINVKVVIQNTGREPGLSFKWDPHPFVADQNIDVNQKVVAQSEWCMKDDTLESGRVIYPTQTTFGSGAYEYSAEFAPDDINDDVLSGKNIMVVTGCIVYKTVGHIRHSSFCYFFKSGTTKPDHLNICNGGNDAD